MPPPTEAAAADTPSPGPRPPAAGSTNTGLRKNTRADSPHPPQQARLPIPQLRHAHRTPSQRHHCGITAPITASGPPRHATALPGEAHPPSQNPSRQGPAQKGVRANRLSPTCRRLSSRAPPQPPPPRRSPEPGPTPREPLVARAHKPPHRAPGTPQPPAPAAEPSH